MKPLEPQKRFSLLYVENDPVAFAHIAKVLSRLGYILHVAENGQEGLRLYQEMKPDLVITEGELPVLDGMEMIRQIKSVNPLAQIIVTAHPTDAVSLMAALDLGVQHYLPKPVDKDRLTAALEKCIENLRQDAELRQMRLLKAALEQGAMAVVITDAAGIIEYASPYYCELAGYSREEAVGQELTSVEAGNRFSDMYRSMSEAFNSGRSWKGEVPGRGTDGESYCKVLNVVPLRGTEGAVENFVGIAEDISLRKRTEEEIRKLNAELEYRMIQRNAALEASKKELDDFCDAVSHDMRGPLSRLQGFSNVLMEECGDHLDEQGKLYVERIGKTARELKQIIDALLNLSQLTRRGMVYQEVDLGAVARTVADGLQAASPDRSIEWVIAPGATVKGDAALLRIVLEQLFGNAFKCTARTLRPRIEFGVARSDSKVVYFVRDNGIGFEQKFAAKMFRPFQRIHSGEEFSGAGMGLASVQRIIQRHGGRIWVEGEVEKGATFYFTLS